MAEPAEVPKKFWVVCGLALLWNLLGLFAFVSQITISPEALAQLPEAERLLYENQAGWVTLAFAVAVFAGTLGSIGLLVRKRWAAPVFLLSLAGILVQNLRTFALGDAVRVYGLGAIFMPLVVVAIAVFLIWFARSADAKGWLR